MSTFHITQTADDDNYLEDTNVAREWRSASITVGHPFIDRAILGRPETKSTSRCTAAVDS